MTSTNDLTKLPKWAQQHIETLERTIAGLKAERNAGPDDTVVFIDHGYESEGTDAERYQPLPRDAQIVFWPHGGYPEHRAGRLVISWDDRRDAVELRSSGSGEVQVVPHVSNVVYVREVDR